VTDRPSGSGEPAGRLTLSEPRPAEQGQRGSFLHELPVLFIVALAVAIVLKTFVVQAFFIPSSSMEPTLEPGDRVLVQKVVYGPDRSDVIVFSDPQGRPGPDRGIVGGFVHWLSSTLGIERPEHEDFIKRVIGLPGETVELRDGRLFVDGVRIREPYLRGAVDTRDYGPVRVPEGALFVLGDNRLNSNDSRFGLGFVPVDKVVGRAFAIVWPPSRVGWIH
jgi:signal peptidase I